jgi:hypothetical protein
MGERLKAAIRRWWQRWRLRRVEALERENTAQANLRDFKPFTGDEPGPPGGQFYASAAVRRGRAPCAAL